MPTQKLKTLLIDSIVNAAKGARLGGKNDKSKTPLKPSNLYDRKDKNDTVKTRRKKDIRQNRGPSIKEKNAK